MILRELDWRDRSSLVTTGSMTCVDDLPDDPALLKQFIAQERQQRDDLITRIREEATQQIEQLKATHQSTIDEAVKAAVKSLAPVAASFVVESAQRRRSSSNTSRPASRF
ncbi:hypothetical protein K2Y11_10730 [bacterium]|nr:hypothetical protein [bacterium]